MKTKVMRVISISAFFVALGLSACGGSSDPAACNSGNSQVNAILNPGGCPASTTAAATGLASLTLSLTNASGAAITSVSPGQNGTLQALVKDSKGSAVPNIAVTFTTSDKTGVFVPASGTALTDASGVARVGLVAGTQAGGFTVTANAAVGATTALGTAGYTVTFPTLTLSALAITPASLSAGGTASLGVTVLNGTSPFTPAQSVIFTSPCATAGKATISSPVITVNGVASTSYTDKGCGGADTITAATSLGGATFTQTGTVTVLAATAGQIAFVSALPQNIAMKGTGGPGRQESSTVTFKVLDKNGNPVAGALVNFFVFSNTGTTSGTGGLTLNPSTANSGVDGTVSTVVAAGIVNTPVRISATINGTSPAVTSISDQLVISTGIPDQNSFSLSTEIFNVEGMNHDGCDAPVGSTVRVSLADHFNNPVPDGTAVSFTAEGGTVDASCLTGLVNTTLTDGTVIKQKGIPGQCTVRFCSASPRQVDGRITILAYALGEESFVDDPSIPNSINRYDPGESFQDLCEPFRNDRAIRDSEANSTVKDANPAKGQTCPTPVVGEPYIDTNGDGLYTKTGDGQYNGVLNIDPVTQQTVASGKTPTVHIRSSLVQVQSTSEANITSLDATPTLSQCVDGTPFVNIAKTFGIAVRDNNPTVFAGNQADAAPLFLPFDLPGNILPAGTTIAFSTSNGTILSGTSFKVPNTNEPSAAAWIYYLTIQSDATQTGPGTTSNGVTNPSYVCSNPVASGLLTVKVTTPLGIITTQTFSIID